MKRLLYAGLALGVAVGISACERPTKQESTYRIKWDNEFGWDGVGPDWRTLGITHSLEKISHRREVMEFPITKTEEGLSLSQQLAVETKQSIVTADDEIMIQEMLIAYNLKPEEEAVKRYFIEHRPEDRHLLQKNMAGLVRTYLQTKTKDWVEANQSTLGEEVLKYIRNFKVGGEPQLGPEGKVIGFQDGYSLEDEWGITITEVTPRRIRPPEYVRNAHPEAEEIIKKAKGDLEAAQSDSERRMSRLEGLKGIIAKIGNNESAAEFLSAQVTYDMVENLGSANVGNLKIISGASNLGRGDLGTLNALDTPGQ